jgi:hypothetical protein
MMFAFALVPILLFIGAAVSYEQLQFDQAKLQTGADQAALSVAGAIAAYVQQNGGSYPPTATIATYKTQAIATFNANTAGFGSLTSANLHVCTPATGDCSATVNKATVALSSGQVALTATASQTKMFSSLLGGPSGVSASSYAGTKTDPAPAPSPATIDYDFQYAKGWWYKVVTLYAVPAGSSTPTALATWTYQPTNRSNIAVPPSALNLTQTSGFPSNPTDTGTGVVTPWYAPNTVLAADGKTILLNQTKDSTGTVTFAKYSNIYLEMDINNNSCAPGMNFQDNTSAPQQMNNDDWNWFGQHYQVDPVNDQQQVTVSCSGSASGNPSWSLIESTNSASNSNYIWIDGQQQPASQIISPLTAFPCPTDPTPGAKATHYYSWEDYDATSGDRDFFFSVTTTCSTGNWTNAPMTGWGWKPVLLH